MLVLHGSEIRWRCLHENREQHVHLLGKKKTNVFDLNSVLYRRIFRVWLSRPHAANCMEQRRILVELLNTVRSGTFSIFSNG